MSGGVSLSAALTLGVEGPKLVRGDEYDAVALETSRTSRRWS